MRQRMWSVRPREALKDLLLFGWLVTVMVTVCSSLVTYLSADAQHQRVSSDFAMEVARRTQLQLEREWLRATLARERFNEGLNVEDGFELPPPSRALHVEAD